MSEIGPITRPQGDRRGQIAASHIPRPSGSPQPEGRRGPSGAVVFPAQGTRNPGGATPPIKKTPQGAKKGPNFPPKNALFPTENSATGTQPTLAP